MAALAVVAVGVDAAVPDDGWWGELVFAGLFLGGLVAQRLLRGQTRMDADGINVRTHWGRRIHIRWNQVVDVQLSQGLAWGRVLTQQDAVSLYGMSDRAVEELRLQMLR